MPLDYIIEIATTDYSTTAAAVQGGADRIELCTALSEGGLTPSFGLISQCRKDFEIALFPIIRPRGGDFLYSDAEFSIMLEEVKLCRRLQCDGIVVGLLQSDGSIDIKRTTMLVEAAYPMEVTFHRAFDRCRDPFEGLEAIIEAGCQRILTSGQQPAAPDGAALIKELMDAASGRIIMMPGSGVRPENIAQLRNETGATEFHTSLRGSMTSSMSYRHPAFRNSAESYSNPSIDPAAVQALRRALQAAE